MSAQARGRDPAQYATFVFKGTVQRLRQATMPSVPVNDKTVVVRVDEVLRAPDALAGYAGHDITVQLGPRETGKRGERGVFYTNGWLFGEGVAVQSVGHTDAKAATAGAGVKPPVQAKADRDLEDHVADADLVVTGRVVMVRVPAESEVRAAGGRPAPISEHSALWREAVIDVDAVGKGRSSPKRVVVRFPSSTDVRWATVPKLHPGQAGVFLLHKSRDTPAGRTSVSKAKVRPPIYALVHRQDFQPPQKAADIRDLVEASPRSKRGPARKGEKTGTRRRSRA
jgi:hypothetical protein